MDALIPAWGLIVEADGRRWHTRVADFETDRWRDNEAVAYGHRVQRFTWAHLAAALEDARQLVSAAGAWTVGVA